MLLFFGSTALMAQGEGNERIRSMKVGFLTERLNLTTEEAELFWPVYNQYQDKKDAIRQEYKANSNKDADAHIKRKEADLALEKEYLAKFKEVLAAEKVLLLHKAEREWKEILLEEVRKRGKKRPPNK